MAKMIRTAHLCALSALMLLAIAAAPPRVHAQGQSTAKVYTGAGSPEGVVLGDIGDIFMSFTGTNYFKNTGPGKTGWVVLAGGGAGTVSTSGSPVANQIACFTASAVLTGTATDIITTHAFFATASGCPAFRAVVAGDIPTLNQNTTGTAANLSGTPALPNGTTGTTQAALDNTTKLATDAFVIGNSFPNPMTTSGDTMYENATPAPARLAAPVPPSGVLAFLTHNGTVPSYSIPGVAFDAQTSGSPYTIPSGDRSSIVTISSGSAYGITLPQSGATNFGNNFNFALANINTGLVTITPQTSQINGGSTQIVPFHWVSYIYGNNTDYRAGTFPDIAAFPSCSTSHSALNFTTATGALGCDTTNVQSGVDVNTSDQVTATHLAAALPVAQGGTGLVTQTANVVYKGNGTGNESVSSITDDGTTATSTDTGGYVAPKFVGNGAGAGYMAYGQGADNCVANQPANSDCDDANPTITTSFHRVRTGTPATGLIHYSYSAPTLTESISAVNLANADVTGQLPIGNVGSSGLSGTSPIGISAAGAISCATCVVASSPGVGIAHFAGSTQTATSSAVALGGADVSGTLKTTANPAGIWNYNQAAQSQVVVSATEYYITRSDLDMPAAYTTAIAAGTTMRWRVSLNKTAAGTGTFQVLLKKGTNGSTADTSIVTQTIGTQTAAADNMEMDVQLTWTSATAAYWTIIPHQAAATGTGFGLVYPAVAAQFNGTISGQTTTTASDKYGLSMIFTTGTPTFLVTEVQAQAFGVN